jgi:hypothetical protein
MAFTTGSSSSECNQHLGIRTTITGTELVRFCHSAYRFIYTIGRNATSRKKKPWHTIANKMAAVVYHGLAQHGASISAQRLLVTQNNLIDGTDGLGGTGSAAFS